MFIPTIYIIYNYISNYLILYLIISHLSTVT